MLSSLKHHTTLYNEWSKRMAEEGGGERERERERGEERKKQRQSRRERHTD